MENIDLLPADDTFSLLENISRLAECKTEEDLFSAVRSLTSLLDFRWAAYSIAMVQTNRFGVIPVKIANINFPENWFRLYLSNCFHLIDPIYIENFQVFGLQVWEETYRKKPGASPCFRKKAEEYGLNNGYTVGAKNYTGTIGTLFSISGGSLEFNPREKTILKTLLPHLHEALLRITEPAAKDSCFQDRPLSAREIELLRLAKTGLETSKICGAMNITERTVYYHMNNIFKKLDASSKAQAVAIAINRGLLEQDARSG